MWAERGVFSGRRRISRRIGFVSRKISPRDSHSCIAGPTLASMGARCDAATDHWRPAAAAMGLPPSNLADRSDDCNIGIAMASKRRVDGG